LQVRLDVDLPSPPDFDRHVVRRVDDLPDVWRYLNPQMLYGKHLGMRGRVDRLIDEGDPKTLSLIEMISRLQDEAREWMRVTEVWRFFEAASDGNRLDVFEPGGAAPIRSFTFPRQPKADGLCLADYVLPPAAGRRDTVAIFVVGAGDGVRERATADRAAGKYLRSHAIQALAIETAEAAAERLHRRLREMWGFPDPAGTTMMDRFRADYRGKRYSPGYPACPDLDQQQDIWSLLDPDEIGIRLTEGMMMEPEASVSAFVFHHPDCRYFSAAGVLR
jgi:5-methyltetrahydrofolate--homocysteine methyltransferase